LNNCLDQGSLLVVTDRFAESLAGDERAALLGHPRVRQASASDAHALTAADPQVTVSVPLGVNVHRLAGGAAVHLVNYDHDHEEDGVRRTGEVALSVRLDGAGSIRRAVYRPADGDARDLELRSKDDVHTMTVPDVGVYAVLELKGAGE
jgi:hypothetical protein